MTNSQTNIILRVVMYHPMSSYQRTLLHIQHIVNFYAGQNQPLLIIRLISECSWWGVE